GARDGYHAEDDRAGCVAFRILDSRERDEVLRATVGAHDVPGDVEPRLACAPIEPLVGEGRRDAIAAVLEVPRRERGVVHGFEAGELAFGRALPHFVERLVLGLRCVEIDGRNVARAAEFAIYADRVAAEAEIP